MKTSNSHTVRFAICIDGSEPDLDLRKLYEVIPDESADQSGYLRIVDESGEDYLYPSSFFVMIELPAEAAKPLMAAPVTG